MNKYVEIGLVCFAVMVVNEAFLEPSGFGARGLAAKLSPTPAS